MRLAQFLKRHILAHARVELERNAAVFQMLDTARNDWFLELESGNTVNQQAAAAIIGIIYSDLVALAAQLFRRREAARARADDARRLRALAWRHDGLHPAFFPGRVCDELFH